MVRHFLFKRFKASFHQVYFLTVTTLLEVFLENSPQL